MGPIAISLNFDSLSEAMGFPKDYRDPSFFEGIDRFFSILEKYDVKISIYMIGKNLEEPEIFARVRDWHQSGHEIGNHTWSHPMNLGSLNKQSCYEEIHRCHAIVTECTGEEPKGFIAPAWSSSRQVIDHLIELEYLYDTSVFPSFIFYPLIIKMLINHLTSPKHLVEVLGRRDWLSPFFSSTKPHYIFGRRNHKDKKILVLPMPTLNRFFPAFWHTLYFIFGRQFTNFMLKMLLERDDFFYYLLHPCDFLGPEDIKSYNKHYLERANVSLEDKMFCLEKAIDMMVASKRPFILVREAEKYVL